MTKRIVIDVKDVIALITKTAVVGNSLSRIPDEELEKKTDDEIFEIMDNYEEYYIDEEDVMNSINESTNFFASVDIAMYPPSDVLDLIRRNNIEIIYVIDSSIVDRDGFIGWMGDKFDSPILIDSKELSEEFHTDYIVSANVDILSNITADKKILMSMPYNADSNIGYREVDRWQDFLAILEEDGFDMSDVSIYRFEEGGELV